MVETEVGRWDVSQLRADEKKEDLSESGVVVFRIGLIGLPAAGVVGAASGARDQESNR